MSASRIPIPKRTRFEVLRRDNYTCVYCGSAAPNIRLVIDHVYPVAMGGTNAIANLVASCEPCNAGKSARILTNLTEAEAERSEILNFIAAGYFNPNLLVELVQDIRATHPAPSVHGDYPEPYGYADAMAEWCWRTTQTGIRQLTQLSLSAMPASDEFSPLGNYA